MERNSDLALLNINSEAWFQLYSIFISAFILGMWYWIADHHFSIVTSSYDDEDLLRLKDSKATLLWERTWWSFTYQMHGQHMSAFMRELKCYTLDPDNPQLNVRDSYNNKNPYAPDRYYKGWGEMRDMRLF